MKIKASRVFIDHQFKDHQEIEVVQGRITVIRDASPDTQADFTIDAGHLLIPGLIDLHTHGAAGSDVMDATPIALKKMSEALAREGITGFLATTMTESITNIEAAIRNVVDFKMQHDEGQGAEILGIHLEGPFLSPAFMGAQSEQNMLRPDPLILKNWQHLAQGLIKIVTLAPELPQATELIKMALENKIIPAIGHTAATFQETIQAIHEGACYATHLFNAMSGLHHRTPGAAAAILYDEDITAELIVDGHHVAPEMVAFALKYKGPDKIVLVTDSMRAKCLKNGKYTLGGQPVLLKDGAVRLVKNGALAGSVLHLNDALKNAHAYTGLVLETLIPLVTETPAKLLERDHDMGSIRVGLLANFAVLDEDLKVTHTIREGEIIHPRFGCATEPEEPKEPKEAPNALLATR